MSVKMTTTRARPVMQQSQQTKQQRKKRRRSTAIQISKMSHASRTTCDESKPTASRTLAVDSRANAQMCRCVGVSKRAGTLESTATHDWGDGVACHASERKIEEHEAEEDKSDEEEDIDHDAHATLGARLGGECGGTRTQQTEEVQDSARGHRMLGGARDVGNARLVGLDYGTGRWLGRKQYLREEVAERHDDAGHGEEEDEPMQRGRAPEQRVCEQSNVHSIERRAETIAHSA